MTDKFNNFTTNESYYIFKVVNTKTLCEDVVYKFHVVSKNKEEYIADTDVSYMSIADLLRKEYRVTE